MTLAGLEQGQDLKALIMGAESSRKKRGRMRLFEEHELAGKEIFEGDQLRIVRNRRIGPLLERQENIEAETVLLAGAFLGRAHDTVTAAGDDHKPARNQEPRKRNR